MADPSRDVIVFVGDGAYLMLNSDVYSSVLTGHKMIIILCDNGGFGVIIVCRIIRVVLLSIICWKIQKLSI